VVVTEDKKNVGALVLGLHQNNHRKQQQKESHKTFFHKYNWMQREPSSRN
jgi:hypothetical protein